MSFAVFTNILTMIFCTAVLVQSVRMMRCLATVKGAALPDMVTALDTSTGKARMVLSDLKEILRTEAAANLRTVAEAESIRDELAVMVGVANATADRLLESATAARREGAEDAEDIIQEEGTEA